MGRVCRRRFRTIARCISQRLVLSISSIALSVPVVDGNQNVASLWSLVCRTSQSRNFSRTNVFLEALSAVVYAQNRISQLISSLTPLHKEVSCAPKTRHSPRLTRFLLQKQGNKTAKARRTHQRKTKEEKGLTIQARCTGSLARHYLLQVQILETMGENNYHVNYHL